MKKKKAKSGREGSQLTHSHHHHGNHRSPSRGNKVIIKQYEEIPNRFRSSIDPLNLEEQKLRFLKHGQIPRFQFKVTPEKIEELSQSKRAEIEFDLLDKAVAILEKVRECYGSGNACAEQMYGETISTDRASRKLSRYLQQNGADGYITVGWTKDQACSAKMAWSGPSMKANRPEARKFSLWLKDSTENQFLREKGILCLADHEIGTHFLRMLNDGLQPWFSNRENFGLKKIRSHQVLETEEGLATINSLIQASNKYLWIPALIYYTACKAATMSFSELFNHLARFLENRELRWRYVMRVKRSLPDPAGVGGYGNDQCYFKGAVEILRNMDNINFHLLYAGKVCLESLPRIQRMARLDCIRLPHFLNDMEAYLKTLRTIASLNGINSTTNKSSGLPRSVGLKGKQKKARVRRRSSKRKLKWTGKVEEENDDTRGMRTTDEKDEDDSEEDQVTDDHNNEVVYDAGRNSRTSTDHPHPQTTSEIKCPMQPDVASQVDNVHDCEKGITPSYTNQSHSSLSAEMARLSPSRMGTKPTSVTVPASPVSNATSLQCSGYKWGAADRMGSHLQSSMPLVSMRYNREKNDSPVPFSPHRWLLWRRDKCSPNTLNS